MSEAVFGDPSVLLTPLSTTLPDFGNTEKIDPPMLDSAVIVDHSQRDLLEPSLRGYN